MALFDALKKIVGGAPSSILGVDIGASSIKVIQLKKEGGRAVLENYGELALGPYAGLSVGQATILPKEKLVVAMEDLLREAHITERRAALSLPMSAAMISFVKMPAVSSKELASMVPIEARKYIPVPMSEVSLDWWPVPAREAGVTPAPIVTGEAGGGSIPVHAEKELSASPMTEVMLAAVRNESVALYQSLKKGAGLAGDIFEIELWSAIRSVVDEAAPLTMLMDMGAGTTKLAMVEKGVIRATHTIRQGSQEISIAISKSLGIPMGDAEEMKRALGAVPVGDDGRVRDLAMLSLSHIFTEANNVLLQYRKRYNAAPARVVMIGGGALLKGMLDIAKEELDAEVVLGDPFARIQTPAFLAPATASLGAGFAVAAGVAMKGLSDA